MDTMATFSRDPGSGRVFWMLILTVWFKTNDGSYATHGRETCDKHHENEGYLSDEYRLMHNLLHEYEPIVRPRYNSSNVVDVNVRFSLQQIYDLDEKRQILTISGWLTAEWTDEFMVWDPEDYGGLKTVVVNPKKIWTPKMAIGNSATKMFHDWRHFWITVRHTGACRWQPGGNFAFTCALKMNFYPFDEQRCTMELETWFYTADKVHLINSMDRFGLETYLRHGEWTVVETSVTREERVYGYYANEAFPEVYFTIHMRRKYTFYFMYILLPCMMLSFVLLMIFLLPAESGEKVSLGVSILIAFCLFLLLVAEQVPDTSDAVPVIAIFLMFFMLITALSVMTSTVILKLHYRGLDRPPPAWLRRILFDCLAPVLCKSISLWSRRHRKCGHYPTVTSGLQAHRYRAAPTSEPNSNGNCRAPPNETDEGRATSSGRARRLLARTLSLEGLGRQVAFDCPPNETAANDEETHCEIPNHRFMFEEWKKVSEVLDRFFFFLFLLFIMLPLLSLFAFIRIFKIAENEDKLNA